MDRRFVDDLRSEAYALSREAVPFLEQQTTAEDRKSVAGLRRTASQTRLTTLLMDAVAWLALLDPQRPDKRAMSLATRVAANEAQNLGDLEPALANLIHRVVNFHRRLENIEMRLDRGSSAYPDDGAAAPVLVSASSPSPTKA